MPSASGDPAAAYPRHDGAAPYRRGFDGRRAAIAVPDADRRTAAPTTALCPRSHGRRVRGRTGSAPRDGSRAGTAARPAIPAGGPATAAGARG